MTNWRGTDAEVGGETYGAWQLACAEGVLVHHFGEATFGELVASGEYRELFERNRARFERKWDVEWPRGRRPDPAHEELVGRV